MKYKLALALLALTSACTPYKEMGFSGGVNALKMQKDVYQIEAKGNAFTSDSRISDFALLKASEIALKENFKSFDLLSGESGYDIAMITDHHAGTFNGSGNSNYAGGGTFNNSFSGTYTAPYTTTTEFKKPKTMLLVKLHKNNSGAYDAQEVFDRLKHYKD